MNSRTQVAIRTTLLLGAAVLSLWYSRAAISQESEFVKSKVETAATSAKVETAENEIQLKKEQRRSMRQMSFQFSDHPSLEGFLLNVGSIDIRVDGYVVRIPLEVISTVQFSKDFGDDCLIRLTNGDSLRGGITKYEFDVVADWGTVQVSRPTLRSIGVVQVAKPTTTSTQQAPTSAAPRVFAPAPQVVPAPQYLPPQRGQMVVPGTIAPPTNSRRIILESPSRYFGN